MTDGTIRGKGTIDMVRAAMKNADVEGPRIRLTKLEPCKNPVMPTPSDEQYTPGGGAINDNTSLPTGYVLEGFLVEDLQEGHSLKMFRYKRNDEYVLGTCSTSMIIAIKDGESGSKVLETANSIYTLDYIEDDQDVEEVDLLSIN